ncbi:MAG: hypothetical protein R3E97_07670 [Candidatus Eisenbacteria bacterium]
MSRVFLIECAETRRFPSLPWSLLASSMAELEPVRLQVHPFALAESGVPADARLVLLDTRFPVRESCRFVEEIAPAPVVLYGPYALDRFEAIPVRAAMIGPAREALVDLAKRAARGGGLRHADVASIPRLAIRRGNAVRSEDADLTSARHAGVAEGGRVQEAAGGTERALWSIPTPGAWPSMEDLLLPFLPSLDWDYRGPRRRLEDADTRRVQLWWPTRVEGAPSIEERDAARVPGVDETTPEPVDIDPRWDPPAREAIRAWLANDPSGALFPLHAVSRDQALSLLVEQARAFGRLGHPTFRIVSSDPTVLLASWLGLLSRVNEEPVEVVLSPSVAALRRTDGMRQELLGAAHRTGRLVVDRVPFAAFDDRSLRLRGHRETHWDLRWVARLLTEIDGSFGGKVRSRWGHRLELLDPWTTPREVIDTLAAIEEDAPFLKGQAHPSSFLAVPSRYSTIGRRIAAAGSLCQGPTESGWDFEFQDPRMGTYVSLAQQGLGPLLEGIGRLRLAAAGRERAITEARFRWIRQLAECVDSDLESATSSWGKVLGGVTREVAIDMKRESD